MRHWFLLLLVWSSLALSQDKGIPTSYMNDAAVDLTRDGKLLLPEEVDELVTSSRGAFDISVLKPIETSDLWKDVYPEKLPTENIPINEYDEVTYNSPIGGSDSGLFRFNVINREGRLYTLMLSKNIHTFLLAKSVLRKIGYQIPDMKHVPKLVVKFKNSAARKIFASYLRDEALAGDPKLWIVEEMGEDKLLLQDLVAVGANHTIYNLAVGVDADGSMIQGRRLLSALAVPLAIVNLQESVNLLRWSACSENFKRIILNLNDQERYQTTWADARWITRRLEKLDEADWKEIVASSNIPKAVQQVLVEKIKSRRNSVMRCFKIDAESFPLNTAINNGVKIVEGKVVQQRWEGYASRFAHEDPDSPVSNADIKTYAKSRGFSTLLDIAVAQVNQLPFLGTDVDALNQAQLKKHLEAAAQQAITDQKPMEVPLKAWNFPTVRGQIIFNRNLVTGSYLGTDYNLVQMVDTLGVSVGAGMFVGTMGIGFGKTAANFIPVQVGASAEAQLLRTYSHLRPVYNLKKAMAKPFKNILPPLVKANYGKKLHEAVAATYDPEMSQEARQEKIELALKPFKEAIEVGESLIVTDSLVSSVAIQAGLDLYSKLLSISLGVVPGHTVVSRFHVHRKSTHDFHVYRDLGQKGSLAVGLGIDTLIPVIRLSLKESKGTARVKYFNLNLDPKNPKVLDNAAALRQALVHSSTHELEENDIKPFVIKHSFKESLPQLNLLFWQFTKQNASTNISVTNPVGDERNFRRQYHGMGQGKNYQAYVSALISHWVGMIFDRKAGISDPTSANPGNSFKGKAKSKYLTLDQEIGEQKEIMEPFIKLTRVWNGWSINRDKAEAILRDLTNRYRFEFFSGPVLNDTRKILFYNISAHMLFYEKGIYHLLDLPEERIREIFRTNLTQESLVINPRTIEDEDTGVAKFLRFLKKFKRLSKKGKDERANKFLLKAISQAELKLNVNGLAELMGGKDNMYLTARIDGFREADELGNQPLLSNSLGEFGSPNTLGPLVQLQKQTEMLEGEFFVYWMMTRLL